MTKMNGLQVWQAYSSGNFNNINNNTSESGATFSHNGYTFTFFNCSPTGLTPVFAAATDDDQKFYLRQMKQDVYLANTSNEPCYISMVHFRVKRNISYSQWSSMSQLLAADAFTAANGLATVTSGNPAQRYLKFGKHKLIKLSGNYGTYHFKMNQKYGNRAISQNLEGSQSFLATTMSTGWILKILPLPHPYWSGTLPNRQFTGNTMSQFNITWHSNTYVSWYDVGVNDPHTTFVDNASAPSGAVSSFGICSNWTQPRGLGD